MYCVQGGEERTITPFKILYEKEKKKKKNGVDVDLETYSFSSKQFLKKGLFSKRRFFANKKLSL